MWSRRVQDIGGPRGGGGGGGKGLVVVGGLEIDKVGEGARLTSD